MISSKVTGDHPSTWEVKVEHCSLLQGSWDQDSPLSTRTADPFFWFANRQPMPVADAIIKVSATYLAQSNAAGSESIL